MALKVELKPGEQVIIGESVITNGGPRAKLYIEGNAPILREKDIMRAENATSPAQRIYLLVQLMYLSNSIEELQDQYFEQVNQIVKAAPSTLSYLSNISDAILADDLYGALKRAKELMTYERTLIGHVSASDTSLSKSGNDDHGS
ncbi:flagellar biosynthesis repressor FlbT [Polycladidibacter stylochi]|uniref:flagellar biosynthesis repressor FlbT n=1 Tax=Polycladidibacter stylochi TaxID=1807766 RepID=UPI00082F42E1|nr:flagellar biosynthesis repressor FlbT [Pseudovibrio stylochi]